MDRFVGSDQRARRIGQGRVEPLNRSDEGITKRDPVPAWPDLGGNQGALA